jgi:ABC-2 type transport system permease protein
MSTAVATQPTLDVAPAWRMVAAQTKATLLFYVRVPAFFLLSMALPIMFYLIFGLPNAHVKLPDGTSLGTLIMAHMAAYAVSSILVFNIGIGRANFRARKLDLLQRATPLPGWADVLANAVGASVLALLSVLVLYAVATLGGGVSLSIGSWLSLTLRLIVGALPLLGLGLAIGYSSGPNAAPAISNLIYLPLSFASGLLIPLQALPDFLVRIAPFLPTYHYAELVDSGLTKTNEGVLTALLWLAGWGIVLFAIAAQTYRREWSWMFRLTSSTPPGGTPAA